MYDTTEMHSVGSADDVSKRGITNGSRTLVLWSLLAILLVVGLWAANLMLFIPEQASVKATLGERGTFGDMFGAVNALFSGLAFAGVVVAIVLQSQELRASRNAFISSENEQRKFYSEERRSNTRQATEAIFAKWWGCDMQELRRYFYEEFVPQHYAKVSGKSLKKVDGRLQRLTGFFDEVGWLGAAQLIDVDYVLGPMQHEMRRVWFATEDLVRGARNSPEAPLDPVFRLGFEWLFRRSEEPGADQADLVAARFHDPSLFTNADTLDLRTRITADEQAFRSRLAALRCGESRSGKQE